MRSPGGQPNENLGVFVCISNSSKHTPGSPAKHKPAFHQLITQLHQLQQQCGQWAFTCMHD
jgi:hypothetical protein